MSTKLGNDIGARQPTSWANNASHLFGCEVEVDETYLGGRQKNKTPRQEPQCELRSRWQNGVGIKERTSKKIKSFKVADTKAITLRQIVCDSLAAGTTAYTDDATLYEGLENMAAAMRRSSIRSVNM